MSTPSKYAHILYYDYKFHCKPKFATSCNMRVHEHNVIWRVSVHVIYFYMCRILTIKFLPQTCEKSTLINTQNCVFTQIAMQQYLQRKYYILLKYIDRACTKIGVFFLCWCEQFVHIIEHAFRIDTLTYTYTLLCDPNYNTSWAST